VPKQTARALAISLSNRSLWWGYVLAFHLSAIEHKSLAAPHDCVAGEARHPQRHGEQVANGKEPEGLDELAIGEHSRADRHGLRQAQKKAHAQQPDAYGAGAAGEHIEQSPREGVSEDQPRIPARPRHAQGSQPT